ncbi:MAG TPA: hypothetical protein PJ992_05300 [Arachnia sp.]|nr:hypothetical protein [Arachnia sp.]HMR14796.1 hypothetical protein [Arachnia sp.]
MTEPTPRSAAPAEVRRLELVGELMASLDGVDELPLDQLANRLGEAQGVLAGVLNNDPSVTQLGIPGVAR